MKLYLIFFILYGCTESPSSRTGSNEIVAMLDSTIKVTDKSKDTVGSINLAVSKIEIVSFNRIVGETKEDEYLNKCQKWDLSKKEVERVIKSFSPLSAEQKNMYYLQWPCEFSGEIKINDLVYKYWLNAGSTLTLKNSKGIYYYFGCASKKCENNFLSGEDF